MKLTKLIMVYTLKLFNTGQITLPKDWRKQFDTKNFLAEETEEGLLIKPIQKAENDVVYYEDKHGFGIYSKKGMNPDKIIEAIKKLNDLEDKE